MTSGSVLVHRTMSLDGFIAGPDHEMDWIFDYTAPESAREVMHSTGAIIAGRHTWAVGERDIESSADVCRRRSRADAAALAARPRRPPARLVGYASAGRSDRIAAGVSTSNPAKTETGGQVETGRTRRHDEH
jgi:hypothetical protein